MAVTDIASRTYNHGWRLDPIVRSLLDTDFYKLLMLQMIREFYPEQQVTFSVINRSKHVRLGEVIDEGELRAQLDHARSLRFAKKELIWLAGNTFYGKTQMFSPDFINWLANFRLPEYELHKVDGQYELHFHGPWTHTTMWEIPALAIMNELRSRHSTKGQGRFVLDVLYARAKAKLWSKVERLRKLDGLRLSDFGTRRRHGFLWQRWCVEAVKEGLGSSFTGTSNVLLAMDNDLEAIGTNAHELPMVAAALANDDTELRRLGRRLDRLSSRQRAADHGRRRHHQMVEAEGPRSPREALGVLRWHGCRFDRGDVQAFRRPRPHLVRLGHQPHQRFRRLRAGWIGRSRSDLAGLQGDVGRRKARGQAVG